MMFDDDIYTAYQTGAKCLAGPKGVGRTSTDLNAQSDHGHSKSAEAGESGLFAITAIPANTIAVYERVLRSAVRSVPNKTSMQAPVPDASGLAQHLDICTDLINTNHAFTESDKCTVKAVFYRLVDEPADENTATNKCDWLVGLKTLRDVAAGEELCFDYNTTESKMACPFVDAVTGRVVSGMGESAHGA